MIGKGGARSAASRTGWQVSAEGEAKMAERAGTTITEVEGSHVIMVSQPEAVADVILTAAATVDRLPATRGG